MSLFKSKILKRRILLTPFSLTTLFILPVIYWRKGRITSSRHDPYGLGYFTCYNDGYKGKQWCESERILKNHPRSDCSLQFENMKMESLVIVDQHATVNLYLSLVLTARHALEVGWIVKLPRFWISQEDK